MIPCEEEIQIRDMARQFAQERLKPSTAAPVRWATRSARPARGSS